MGSASRAKGSLVEPLWRIRVQWIAWERRSSEVVAEVARCCSSPADSPGFDWTGEAVSRRSPSLAAIGFEILNPERTGGVRGGDS